jgi:hypothetical protein
MTAQALGDLVGILFELFVDDGGMAGDDFTKTLANIRTLLTRVREKGLSLSAATLNPNPKTTSVQNHIAKIWTAWCRYTT